MDEMRVGRDGRWVFVEVREGTFMFGYRDEAEAEMMEGEMRAALDEEKMMARRVMSAGYN